MRERLLVWLVEMSIRRRFLVLGSAAVVTAVAIVLSGQLRMDVRWSTILPESMPVVAEYEKIDESFLQPANMIVVISGPDRLQLEQITDEVEAQLQAEMVCEPDATTEEVMQSGRFARQVYGSVSEEWIGEHLLHLVKPTDAERLAELYRDPRLLPFLIHLNDDLEREYSDAENVRVKEREVVATLDAVQRLGVVLDRAASGEIDEARVRAAVRDLAIGSPYQVSLDGTTSLVFVAPAVDSSNSAATPLIDRKVEELLRPFQERYPEYTFERTGTIAIGRDELESVGPQTLSITLAAIALVFLMLVWNYRSALVPMLAVTPLLAGVIWTMGAIAVTLGQMNIISSMIMVILIGLGIDFSIHVTNRFTEELGQGRTIREALVAALGDTGVAVITGAVTTSVAFLMLMTADTRGIKEFGFCAGLGVLMTLLAVFWILPALLAWRAGALERRGRQPVRIRSFGFLGTLAEAMGRRRVTVVLVYVVIVALGAFGGSLLEMEWNFLELEPRGLRSVQLQDEIVDAFKLSTTVSMLTVPTIEESRRLREQLKDKRLIGDVDDISLWVSRPDVAENEPHIRRLRREIGTERAELPLAGGGAGGSGGSQGGDDLAGLDHDERRSRLAEEVDRLWANLVEIQALSITGGQDRVVEKTARIVARRADRDEGMLRRLADRLAEGEQVDWTSLDLLATLFRDAMGPRVRQLAASDEPVTEEMLLPADRARYVSREADGYLLSVLPRHNLYEKDDLERFSDITAEIDPNVTGMPQLILEMNKATLREGRLAFLLALGVIFLVLLADFRRPLPAFLCLLPLLCGSAVTFGVLWLLGEKLNYINLVAFPVILGIGVDDGVHFMHRYLQEGRGKLGSAVASVGQAMTMSSLTTMISFGSLMFYLMVGMASMGLVLFVGVGACLVVTLTLLPALAMLFESRLLRTRRPAAGSSNGSSTTAALLVLIGLGILVAALGPGAQAASPAGETAAGELTAEEVLRRNDRAEGYASFYSEMQQIISTSSGGTRTLVLRSWAVDNGEQQLAEFLEPADIRGQRILMANDGDDIWMFNAETRRTRKLGSHMKKKRVMGADFTYEDMAGGTMSEKYTGTVLRHEEVAGEPCIVLELEPTPSGPSYDKVITWLGAGDFVTRRVDYYQDGSSEPFKRLICEDLREVDGKRVPFTMTMTNLEDGTETINTMDSIRLGVEIPDAVFDPRNLGR